MFVIGRTNRIMGISIMGTQMVVITLSGFFMQNKWVILLLF